MEVLVFGFILNRFTTQDLLHVVWFMIVRPVDVIAHCKQESISESERFIRSDVSGIPRDTNPNMLKQRPFLIYF